MTSELTSLGPRKGAPFFYAGWAGFALFGLVVYLDGSADLSYAVFHVVVAAAICTWYAMTTGRAAPIVGIVLGALFALQMVFFVFSGFFGEHEPAKTRVEDALALLAAVSIVYGAAVGLRGRLAQTLKRNSTTSPSAIT